MGDGIHSRDIINAENTLETLFYNDEKNPHVWWDKFENELTSASTAYDLKERRQVHSNEMKLRILIKKIDADFLMHTKSSIKVELSRIPLTVTYEIALSNSRDEVNSKFNSTTTLHRTRRTIQSTIMASRGGRGRGRFQGGRGRGYGNYDRATQGIKRRRNDSSFITLTDGEVIEYHQSFRFPNDVYIRLKPEDRQQLLASRDQHKKSRAIQSL